jgi:hypothetical protein
MGERKRLHSYYLWCGDEGTTERPTFIDHTHADGAVASYAGDRWADDGEEHIILVCRATEHGYARERTFHTKWPTGTGTMSVVERRRKRTPAAAGEEVSGG